MENYVDLSLFAANVFFGSLWIYHSINHAFAFQTKCITEPDMNIHDYHQKEMLYLTVYFMCSFFTFLWYTFGN